MAKLCVVVCIECSIFENKLRCFHFLVTYSKYFSPDLCDNEALYLLFISFHKAVFSIGFDKRCTKKCVPLKRKQKMNNRNVVGQNICKSCRKKNSKRFLSSLLARSSSKSCRSPTSFCQFDSKMGCRDKVSKEKLDVLLVLAQQFQIRGKIRTYQIECFEFLFRKCLFAAG